jgi:hypothetical protein
MKIDLTQETAITLAQVPDLPWVRGRADGRLHVATVHCWCTRGIRGHKLEFVQRGGTRVTTEAALLRFFQGLTEDRETHGRPSRRRTVQAAEDGDRQPGSN